MLKLRSKWFRLKSSIEHIGNWLKILLCFDQTVQPDSMNKTFKHQQLSTKRMLSIWFEYIHQLMKRDWIKKPMCVESETRFKAYHENKMKSQKEFFCLFIRLLCRIENVFPPTPKQFRQSKWKHGGESFFIEIKRRQEFVWSTDGLSQLSRVPNGLFSPTAKARD